MKLSTIFVFLRIVLLSSSETELTCIDKDTGELINGQFVENGVCVEESVWYYALVSAPIASNGLLAGAPTDLHLQFGSLGNPIEDAFDPQNYGLYIKGGMGRMTLDLSPHFIYDQANGHPAQALFTTELALGPANIFFSAPCIFDQDTEKGQTVCTGWTSELGENNRNQIHIIVPDGLFGKRALEVGIKFFHLHPVIELGSAIYHNANGTCDDAQPETTYCRFASDCTDDSPCIPATEPFTASVTATLLDENGKIQHKGTRSYTLDTEPRYATFSTNTRVASHNDVVEMIDFQRVEPGAECVSVTRADGSDFFSSGVPYAPRFFLFGPSDEATAFPQLGVANVATTLTSPTTGLIFSGQDEIGSFELLQPNGASGQILEENLGYISDGPPRIGGTLFAVPVKTGDIPGKYIVQVTVAGGTTAQSRFIVTESTTSAALDIMRLWMMPMIFPLFSLLMV
jgi:hypothetical protein